MSKFCYEENELKIADSQCDFCKHYNNGAHSECCPNELIGKIKTGQLRCPNFYRPSLLSAVEKNKAE